MTQKTHRVLSIESDARDYQSICAALQGLPLEVLHASNGAEALAFLAREMPPLILLDVTLPDMRGWDVIDKYKSDERLRAARVVVVTAESSAVHRLIGSLQDAVVGYVTKPIQPSQLQEVVRWALELDA